MKIREIILDFTSLLDVIMIILFFFILNYRQQMQTRVEQAEQTAAAAVAAADTRMEEADALQLDAEAALAAMDSTAQAENTKALLAFSKAGNVNICLVTEEEGWRLDVYQAGTRIGSVTDRRSQKIGLELNRLFAAAGYAPDGVILCVFSYDSTKPGTRAAYETVTEAFGQIKTGNRHFYYTELDGALLGAEGE